MTPTIKLFDEDSYLKEFTADVISCEPFGEKWAVVLDKTAFFPEAGGQPSDKGTLDFAEVIDVRIDKNGIITHICDAPIKEHTVCGRIDFERRFVFMQNHTGEHIVSGTVHKLYGLDNIGFHLSEDAFVTLDFNGDLTRTQLDDIEMRANLAVWNGASVRAYYPDENELKTIAYRSKKELDGDIRIVAIDGCDVCACCAPHVKDAAAVGIIKLLDTEKMHGGTRIVMKCGKWALCDYREKYGSVAVISALTSAKHQDTAVAVEKLYNQLTAEKQRVSALKRRLISEMIKTAEPSCNAFFEDGLDTKELQLYADGLYKAYGGIKGAFSPVGDGYAFAICGAAEPLDEFFAEFRKKFTVRGGGRNGMVQGNIIAQADKIKLCF